MTAYDETPSSPVVYKGWAAIERLEEWGLLPTEGVLQALQLAQGDRLACTEFDPPAFAGQTRSARAVRYLRETYAGSGWHKSDRSNYSLLVRDDGKVAIQVATGNDAVGDSDVESGPRLAHPKGPKTGESVQRNQFKQIVGQINLLTGEAEGLRPNEEVMNTEDGPTTLILVLCERQGHLHCEISLPVNFAEGQVLGWSERMILDPIPFDSDELGLLGPTQPGPTPTPTPTITKRSA